MRDNFLVFGKPDIHQDEIDEVCDSMRVAWLGTGPKVSRFEKEFSAYKNASYAAAVNSCTAALHLSCLALGLRPGDEVITTSMTFCATINAIIQAGATPVLVDIDPRTLNIDPDKIEEKISPRTKAILIVHFAGRSCAMDRIVAIVQKHHLYLIEDCAHAIETEYHGKKSGNFGDFGCFSFYATKNITTGEGGMVVSPHKDLIDQIKIMALHGLSADAWHRFSDSGYKHYFVIQSGFKYNMMDLQASIGIHQLKRIEQNWLRRQRIWQQYLAAFQNSGLGLPSAVESGTRHAHHLFTVRINAEKTGISRDRFIEEMTKNKIGVGVHYLSIPEHPYYQEKYSWKPQDYPHATTYGRETVSLPLSAGLSPADIDDVINITLQLLKDRP